MVEKVIFHVDVNNAFLSWEAIYRLNVLGEECDLRTIPSAIGGDMSKRHGVILAKSTIAKQYNIKTGEPIVDALRKCPGLVIVKPNHDLYEEQSAKFLEILNKYSPVVEQYSIDEAFIDMTGMERLFGKPIEAAHALKDEVYNTLGFTVNVGISSNKLLAKMAGDFEKPNKVHTLFPDEIEKKMWPLPVGDLLFVGKASEKRLNSLGIRTIGELAKADIGVLRAVMKKQGETLYRYANGIDGDELEIEPEDNKGYGNSTTISFDVTDSYTAKRYLLRLSENVSARLRQDNVRAGEVSVTIKYYDLTKESHQGALETSTNITKEIYEAACRLFDELWEGIPIRLLGVRAGKISHAGSMRQLSLFDNTDYEKLEKLDKAVDKIRGRFGNEAIKPASFLEKDKFDKK
ncbi:MAG: DNA polymerase IV [Lachnospiraceae bacterium]|nr:DNA polymerase IV [Lachnospiraceae bacterium]